MSKPEDNKTVLVTTRIMNGEVKIPFSLLMDLSRCVGEVKRLEKENALLRGISTVGRPRKTEPVQRVIYMLWTESNPLTENRKRGLESASALGCEVRLLTPNKIKEIEIPEHPFHEGYKYLSSVHKSDYLRSYLMNFYGGGYADIKVFTDNNNWKECFNYINEHDELDLIGSPETVGGSPIEEFNNKEEIRKLVSNCFFIARPHSDFTASWYRAVNRRMDELLDELKKNPGNGKDPYSRAEGYPLRWAEIQGLIFHPEVKAAFERGRVSRMLMDGRDWGKVYR